MPSPLSMDLRKRAVKAYENGEGTLSEIAERFDISVSSLTSWRALIRSGEGLEPRPHSGGKHHQKIFAEYEKALQDWLEESPDSRLIRPRQTPSKKPSPNSKTASDTRTQRPFQPFASHSTKGSLLSPLTTCAPML